MLLTSKFGQSYWGKNEKKHTLHGYRYNYEVNIILLKKGGGGGGSKKASATHNVLRRLDLMLFPYGEAEKHGKRSTDSLFPPTLLPLIVQQ